VEAVGRPLFVQPESKTFFIISYSCGLLSVCHEREDTNRPNWCRQRFSSWRPCTPMAVVLRSRNAAGQ